MVETRSRRRSRPSPGVIRAAIDLLSGEPLAAFPVRDEATSFIVDGAMEAVAAAEHAGAGFLAITGECRFPRAAFPEDWLSPVSDQVSALVRAALAEPGATAAVESENHRILVRVLPDRGSVRSWIEERMRGVREEESQKKAGLAATDPEADLASLGEAVDAAVRSGAGGDFAWRKRVLASVSDAVRARVAAAFAEDFNADVALRPKDTYEAKKALAKEINAELRRLGLAIRCPKTGEPMILQAYPGNRPDEGRFRLETTDDSGKRRVTVSWMTLPPLDLMPDTRERVPYGHGQQANR